jgi:DNA-binding transcriptional regulator YbjK
METELGETWSRASNVEKLEEFLQVYWITINKDRMEGLIQSMPVRLKTVIDVNGGSPLC